MMVCTDEATFIESGINRILTQYRESPKLIHMIRTYMRQVWLSSQSICDLPSSFNLDTAVGDQLTILGKWMGFPRCHCVCDVQPVFGFACEDVPGRPIVGFCEDGSWLACGEDGVSEICITDDDVYRRLLVARSFQMQARYGLDDLIAALQAIYGPTASVLDAGQGRVVLAPFRALTEAETVLLQIVPRVLPVAPGVTTRWHFGTRQVFGFGAGWGGFCEEWLPEGVIISDENGNSIVTEFDDFIVTEALTQGADWMCEVDVKPYSC